MSVINPKFLIDIDKEKGKCQTLFPKKNYKKNFHI